MRIRNIFIIGLFSIISLALMIINGCSKSESPASTPAPNPSIVYGIVLDDDYSTAIRGASVVSVGQILTEASSDSLGRFELSFGNLTANYNTYLNVTAPGYEATLIRIEIKRGESLTILIRLKRAQGEAGVIITNPDVIKAAQVAYIGTSASDIYISGVGALENSVITYEVRDSLGRAVPKLPRYGATFSINFFPNVNVGGGTPPRVIPPIDSTDANGRLRVSVVSGTQAGVVQVLAKIHVDDNKIITSEPVRITVHGGFPDPNHFTLMASRFVFPGWESVNEVRFSVAVGDTFSNPVPANWAVYFSSQAGIMTTGKSDFNAYTDNKGLASANLLTANPRPATLPFYDPVFLGGRIGGHWVYAHTMGRNNIRIVDSVLVIWNRAPILVGLDGATPSTNPTLATDLTMNPGGTTRNVTMTVTDANGNPLCDGTTINVYVIYTKTINADLNFDVSGNVPTKIPCAGYCRFPGYGVTDFNFRVVDNSHDYFTGSVTLVIEINAPGLATAGPFKFPVTVEP